MPITWRPRERPLAPAAVAATGTVARDLARRLLAETDEALARVRAVAGAGLLVVLGDEAALPWVDGVVYLGADPRARSLLLPTAVEPAEPIELVERALALWFPNDMPMALLAGFGTVVPVASARPVTRPALERWLASEA